MIRNDRRNRIDFGCRRRRDQIATSLIFRAIFRPGYAKLFTASGGRIEFPRRQSVVGKRCNLRQQLLLLYILRWMMIVWMMNATIISHSNPTIFSKCCLHLLRYKMVFYFC